MAKKKRKISFIIIFLIAVVVAFATMWFISDGKLFFRGTITYDESLTEEERNFLSNIFTDEIKLKYDATISATSETSPSNIDNALLYDILVPVADFYYPASNISTDNLENTDAVQLISINDLDTKHKLLKLDGNYYLDDFNSGAKFRFLHIASKNPAEAIDLITPRLANFPTKETTLSFSQTGVTALSRRMNAKLASVTSASFFAENIQDFLSSKDLTHTSNESSFSDYATADNICSKPGMIDALTSIGLNIVELTGNHNQDCGDESALATIDTYNSLGIKIVGGGKNATEAATPLEINQKNTHITMLGYNLSTGGYTLDNTPGANFYTVEKATTDIAAAKERGDFVIVDVQYYECNAYDVTHEDTTCDPATSVSGEQDFFRSIIDLGADIVVGTSAHQPQTYELYGNGAIYYGLGNLFFDQSWWPGTTRSLILTHYFIDGKHVQTRLTPTVYNDNYQTSLMDEETSSWFIERLNQAR